MSRLLNPKVLVPVLVVLAVMIGSAIVLRVPLPAIVLPGEKIFSLGPLNVTNTLFTMFVVDLVILGLAIAATRSISLVPSGLQNVVEMMVEGFYNLTEDIAGHDARKFFPWVMTIFLLVLGANWLKLVPGAEAIGWLESHEGMTHYRVVQVIPGVKSIVADPLEEVVGEGGEEASHEEGEAGAVDEEHGDAASHSKGEAYHELIKSNGNEYGVLVPFWRGPATDLNFTLSLAIITMVVVQIFGIQALGAGYFSKFLNLKGGVMGFIVGIIEAISEVAKIVSFAFRLFGNLFAGTVLLAVMTFLIPVLLPVPFFGLEIFVGFIQAFVFAMLALVFMAGAVVSHDEHH